MTIDRVFIGDIASEAAHHFASDQSSSGGEGDGRWRDAKGFLSYEMKVVPDAPVAVRARYYGGDENRQFDVLVDGQRIATQQLVGKRAGAALFGVYPLPPELTRGKQNVTVRLQPKNGSIAGGVFDLRRSKPTQTRSFYVEPGARFPNLFTSPRFVSACALASPLIMNAAPLTYAQQANFGQLIAAPSSFYAVASRDLKTGDIFFYSASQCRGYPFLQMQMECSSCQAL